MAALAQPNPIALNASYVGPMQFEENRLAGPPLQASAQSSHGIRIPKSEAVLFFLENAPLPRSVQRADCNAPARAGLPAMARRVNGAGASWV